MRTRMGRRAAVARVRSSHILKAMWGAEEGGLAGSRIAGDDESRMLERVFEADRLAEGKLAACAGIGRSGQGDVEVLDGEAVGLARAYLKPADIDEGGVFAQGLKVF